MSDRRSALSEDDDDGFLGPSMFNENTVGGEGKPEFPSYPEVPGVVSPSPLEGLQEELALQKQRVLEYAERVARAQAEVENMRKRTEKDVINARKFALESFSRDLITVMDSLEQGLAAFGESAAPLESVREGMTITLQMLSNIFERFSIVGVQPKVGENFDPNLHEAMSMQDSLEAKPGTIIQVVQKGYQLHDRLLRPARVIVVSARG